MQTSTVKQPPLEDEAPAAERGRKRMTEVVVKDTRDLVEALSHREGVEKITVEPYQNKTVTEDGPAVILIIKD